jgi:hypothetical protein
MTNEDFFKTPLARAIYNILRVWLNTCEHVEEKEKPLLKIMHASIGSYEEATEFLEGYGIVTDDGCYATVTNKGLELLDYFDDNFIHYKLTYSSKF